MDNAQRYERLRDWLLQNNIVTHHALTVAETEPFVMGAEFYGETFEAAVDTL